MTHIRDVILRLAAMRWLCRGIAGDAGPVSGYLWLSLCGFACVNALCAAQIGAEATPADVEALRSYIRTHGEKPTDYVVRQFQTHQIVFLGEHHFLKRDVEFVQSLIPALYKNGIYNLGIEYGCHRDQKLVDQLLTAAAYDEDAARLLMFRCYVLWGYKEYIDLYRVAWRLNVKLPHGKPKFRIVHLNAESDWSQLAEDTLRPLGMQKVWPKGTSDEVMAQVIMDEFVAKTQKALIYCGTRHALSGYDERSPRGRGVVPPRAGRAVYEKIGDRAFTICLHATWQQRDDSYAPPVGGAIDAVFAGERLFPAAFDTRGTPFGKLQDRQSYYARGRDALSLEDFCDGYIFLKPRDELEMVTIDHEFITEGNLKLAIQQIPDPQERAKCRSVSDIVALMREQAESGLRAARASERK